MFFSVATYTIYVFFNTYGKLKERTFKDGRSKYLKPSICELKLLSGIV